ncbi:MAG: hypothetical protein HUU23_17830 [Caldilineales bacterium]|nr:hypothetical protein [Caldilineales bacterium]
MITLSPMLLLLALLGLIYAAIFHFWRGKGWGDLALTLLAAGLGMALGQMAGAFFDLDLPRIGQTRVVEGSVAAWLLMFAAAWLKG